MGAAEINQLLAEAAQARASGRLDIAEARFRAVLKEAPDHAGALNALGALALGRNDPAEAADLFSRAVAAEPQATALWVNLAKAKRLLCDDEGERESLDRLLALDQRHLMGLVRLAELHERRGELAEAERRWSGVLAIGAHVDPRTAELEAVLAHASAFVASRTSQFAQRLDETLAAKVAAAAPPDRRRFSACVDHMLGRRPIYTNNCAGLHYPFLPADEFFDREHFPWFSDLESEAGAIRAELEALLEEGQGGFAPYVSMEPGLPPNKWSGLDKSLDWSALHLWREGERVEDACARAPITAAVIECLPLAPIPGRAPTVFFSLLRPHSRIPAHTGVSNIRTIVHLPLIVPENCRFRVGGETRAWKEGEAFAFDDTIEHEAWNDSDELRALLIFDVWNPHLSACERALLQDLFSVEQTADEQRRSAVSETQAP